MVLINLLDDPKQILATNNHTIGVGTALYECLFTTLSTQNYKSAIAIIPSRNESSLVFHMQKMLDGFKILSILEFLRWKMKIWKQDRPQT